MNLDLIVIGAGAGGCFAAIRLGELHPGATICVLESGRKPLSKVEISGGGRCNVTHACFDPEELVNYYPRGSKELLGPFYTFQPSDMVQWLQSKGVKIKKEEDGRMFPVSDSSATIIDCFLNAMHKYGIELKTVTRAVQWNYDKDKKVWQVELQGGKVLTSRFLLIASGSDSRTWEKLKEMGHEIIPDVPSLFTFNIRDKNLTCLLGISVPKAVAGIPQFKMETEGPLLITHWGLSGPAILKLSAWGARELYGCNYVFDVVINWTGQDQDEVEANVHHLIKVNVKKQVVNLSYENIPGRLWKYLCTRASIPDPLICADLNKKQLEKMVGTLSRDTYRVTGKSTFKEEFVTAGGVDLKNVDMRRFESKIRPGLFLVGEVLNIDALTGGFNFQAAWTGAEMAAQAIAAKLKLIE